VNIEVPSTATAPPLTLRPWRDTDADELINIYRDPAMHRWVRTQVRTREEALTWLATQKNGWHSGDRLSFAVHDGEERLVGCVVLKNPHTEPEVGYWTAAAARGRGIASHALDALSRWAFTTRGVLRLKLLHQVDNVASCRVAEKSGYHYESTLPAEPPFPLDGHVHIRHANA
jgi:RimJ/RimL family protein N-acetyltransferase